MSHEDVHILVREIPIYEETIASVIESILGDELEVGEFHQQNNQDKFDVENMDIVNKDQINNQEEVTENPNT